MGSKLIERVLGRLTLGATIMQPRNPLGWMWMRLIGRFVVLRERKADDQRSSAHLLDEADSLFPQINTGHVVSELRRTGFASGFTLPPEIVSGLTTFFSRRQCYPNGDRKQPTDSIETAAAQGAVTAYYFNTMESPDMRRIANDPKILNICRLYFGSEPFHLGNQAWWSFPLKSSETQQSAFAQKFHFDLDGWRFLKFFFYLTDVTSGTGEHTFVLESHRARPLSFQINLRRYSDKEVAETFPAKNIKTILGPRGSGFVEDTFGIHKGNPPTTGRRLYFEIEYANSDYRTPNDRL